MACLARESLTVERARACVCVSITFIAHEHNRAFEMDILLTGGHIAVLCISAF